MNRISAILLFSIAVVIGGCTNGVESSTQSPSFPTPTFHGLFVLDAEDQEPTDDGTDVSEVTPTIASFFMKAETPTPLPTKTPNPTVVPSISEFPLTDSISTTIYADSFNPNWKLERGSDVDVTIRTNVIAREGKYSIVATPKEAYSHIFFIVTEDSTEIYPLNQVLGFRFWINSGDGYLEPDDLAITVFGSNEFPYYVEGDDSVTSNMDPVFSETRLYYLGFNRSIPPYTWAEVILWMDDRIFDPYYEYVVGFYIKNEEDFLQTFYIDNVRLILLNDEPLPTRIPD